MGAECNSQGNRAVNNLEQQTPTRKRRRTTITPSFSNIIDLTNDDDEVAISSSKKKKTSSPRRGKDGEKRLKMFRKQAPQSYLEKLNRALGQRCGYSMACGCQKLIKELCRMFVIDRIRQGTSEAPEEVIEMAGSTGNVYHVTISKLPHCTCPDNMKGNQCKHIVYV